MPEDEGRKGAGRLLLAFGGKKHRRQVFKCAPPDTVSRRNAAPFSSLTESNLIAAPLWRQRINCCGLFRRPRKLKIHGMHWAKTTGMVPDPSGGNLGCSCSFDVILGCLPIPGQQFIDSLCRMIAESSEDVGEPGLRVDVV
jgi:hypothetical protein